MKIEKYKKDKGNIYKVIIDNKEYKLYDDIIIKSELLLKKNITKKELENILKENSLLAAYYDSIKYISIKMRCEKEIVSFLKKKEYDTDTINTTIKHLKKDGYLNSKVYIEAYIHDRLALYTEGEKKIKKDLMHLGFFESEINIYLNKINQNVYIEKIEKYITKKLKSNKKSANEFKRKTTSELITKGFNIDSISSCLDKIEVSENEYEIEKIINRLYNKYINKYDIYTTKNKIKEYLYRKGYQDIDIDDYIKKIPN